MILLPWYWRKRGNRFNPQSHTLVAKVHRGDNLYLGALPLAEKLPSLEKLELKMQIHCFKGCPTAFFLFFGNRKHVFWDSGIDRGLGYLFVHESSMSARSSAATARSSACAARRKNLDQLLAQTMWPASGSDNVTRYGCLRQCDQLLAQTKTDRHTHLVCYSPNTTGHDWS